MDPDGLRQRGVLRWSFDESFRVSLVGSIENGLSIGDAFLRLAVVNGSGGRQREAGVMMRLVVPREELLAEATGLFEGTKVVGKARPVFQRFEVGFRVGVVGADMRAAVRLDDTAISQQQSHGLGSHRGAPVGRDRQLARHNLLLFAALFDELFGSVCRCALGDHPAGHITAENVQNDV